MLLSTTRKESRFQHFGYDRVPWYMKYHILQFLVLQQGRNCDAINYSGSLCKCKKLRPRRKILIRSFFREGPFSKPSAKLALRSHEFHSHSFRKIGYRLIAMFRPPETFYSPHRSTCTCTTKIWFHFISVHRLID